MAIVTYNNFTGGLITDVPPDNLEDNELMKCDNYIPFRRGGFYSRKGTEKINSTSYGEEIDQLIEWVFRNGQVKLLAMMGKKLYEIKEDGTRVLKYTMQSNTIGYVMFRDALYFVDGDKYYVYGEFKFYSGMGTQTVKLGDVVKNTPVSTGGGTLDHFYLSKSDLGSIDLKVQNYADTTKWTDITDTIGIIPDDIREVTPDSDVTCNLKNIKKCKFMMFHHQSYRIFAAGNPDDPTALYISEIGKPNFFKETLVLYPTTEEGNITALKEYMKTLVVCYKNSIRTWNGIEVGADATWKRMAVPTGCINNSCIELTPVTITFLSRNGMYIMTSALLNDEVTMVATKDLFFNLTDKKVSEIIKSIVHPETARMIYHDDIVYLAYGDDLNNPRNNKVLIMDWYTRAFAIITGWQVNDWCVRQNGDLLFASKNYILKTNVGNNDIDVDSGEFKSINCEIHLKPYSLGGSSKAWITKFVRRLFISAKQFFSANANIKIDVITDYQDTSHETTLDQSLVWGRKWGNGSFFGFSDLVNQECEIYKLGLRHQVRVSQNSLDTPTFVYGIGFDFDDVAAEASLMTEKPLISDY